METNVVCCDGLLFLTGAPGRFVCTCGHVGDQSELVRCDGVWRHPVVNRRATRLEQLQTRDHQRRMPPSDKAWFVVAAMEFIAWCVFTAYVVWRVAVFGGAM